MFKRVGIQAVLLFILFGRCLGYCSKTSIKNIGTCAYSVECQGTIRDVNLAVICDRLDYPVSIELTLTNAVERFEDAVTDVHFLKNVTTLRASGTWKNTSLSILKYTPALRTLYLSGNKMTNVIEKPFYNLNNLINLDISENRLVKVENLFKFQNKRSKLRRLFMAHNEIRELPKRTFEQLEFLIELDLSHNYLNNISHGPFYRLRYLRKLNLNYNRIVELNGALNHLTSLKHLHLRANAIKAIEDDFLPIVHRLETFDVALNDIDNLQSTFFLRNVGELQCHPICKMIFSNNNIVSIPNATDTRHMTHSKSVSMDTVSNMSVELDLSENDINEIAYDAFQGTTSIVSLDLSQNSLDKFIIKSQDLSDVKRLNLSSNYLNELFYETFSSMSHLEVLDISYNVIESIMNGTFVRNYELKFVNITNNHMIVLNGLHITMFHPDGGFLDLSYNNLTKLTTRFREAIRLRTLMLNFNNINDTFKVDLHFQQELKILEMSGNNIQVLCENCLRLPSSLIHLDLSYNKIATVLPSSFLFLSQLQTLRLSHNRLKEVVFGAYRGLKILKNLDLSHNKIKYLEASSFADLKSLRVLSLRYNEMYKINYKQWIGHNYKLSVYLEGNNFTCEWLNEAIYYYEIGFSSMRPAILDHQIQTKHAVQNIPCISEGKEVGYQSLGLPQTVMADERLLVTNRRILDEIMFQNDYLKKILNKIVEKESLYDTL